MIQFLFILTNTLAFAQSFQPNTSLHSAKHCRIEIEKQSNNDFEQNRFQINSRKGLRAKKTTTIAASSQKSFLILSSGREGSLRLDAQKIKIKCIKTNKNIFHLDLSIQHNNSFLSTSISVTKNQKINIGSIVSNLQKKANNSSAQTSRKSGIKYKRTNSNTKIKNQYYLVVN